MSVSDRDIYATALQFIRLHGEAAFFEAALRADEQIAKGDADGERVWKRIAAAILTLTSEPSPDVARH